MILTITCNPAIDKSINGNNESFNIGGKGINVSKALNTLGLKSMVTGFLGKDNKDLFIEDLDSLKLPHHFVLVDGKARTNTKTIINNELYEENEVGPYIDLDAQKKLKEYLNTYMNSIVVISGSAGSNVESTYYKELIEIAKTNNCYVIFDASKDLFKEGIKAIPNCIKPNKQEICELFNIEYDKNLMIEKCKELLHIGIELIVVSLSEEGSIIISNDGVYEIEEIELNYVSSLGAGDSMVAALAYGKENNLSLIETIKLAVASARCTVEEIGIFSSKEKVFEYINNVKVKEMEELDK